MNEYENTIQQMCKRIEFFGKSMSYTKINFAFGKTTKISNIYLIVMKRITSLIALGLLITMNTDAKSPVGHITTDGIEATTQSGKIAGYRDASGIYTYKGVPYATAKRFEAPVAVEPWEATRSCRNFGPTAPQDARQGWLNDPIAFAFNWDDGFPGEDCLRLNIWTKAAGNDGKKRPVMVWLHGGGFSAGSGQELPGYDGANLADKGDVVVVTLNHRLNVLGFLDLSDYGDKYAVSANAGMLDIVAALDWVNKNIEQFGGDPENVTIFGQSGGGGKVSTLLAMPAAKGLFHKAIVQSGSACRTMTSDYSRRIGRAVVKELGLENNVDAIADVPYSDLLAAANKALANVRAEIEAEGGTTPFIFGWAPSVDGNVLPDQPFDGKAPEISREIPMIIGTTRCEFSPTTYMPALRNADMATAKTFLERIYGDKTDEFIEAYGKAYPGYQPKDLIDCDTRFRPGAVEQADVKSAQGGAPVYMYMFTWESPVLEGSLRSTHCMEIPFVFNNADVHASMTGGGDDAMRLADKMSDAWIAFARTGNPNSASIPEWPAYSKDGGATMIFNNECDVWHNHDRELLELTEKMAGKRSF